MLKQSEGAVQKVSLNKVYEADKRRCIYCSIEFPMEWSKYCPFCGRQARAKPRHRKSFYNSKYPPKVVE